jgi:hypothetical protein
MPIPVDTQSNARVYRRSLAGIAGSKRAWMSLVSVVCYQAQVSATSQSLFQRIPTDCGVSDCDLET